MDEDDDDFYGNQAGGANGDDYAPGDGIPTEPQADPMDVNEEEDEEDSDDDVQFTLERPPESAEKTTSQPQTRAAAKTAKTEKASTPTTTRATRQTTIKQESAEPAANDIKSELLHDGKEGKDFPEVRTSDIDLEDDPVWAANGKKITDVDIDADLVENSKPWRLPGTDITDFFNYGFDEYTWTQYCAKQRDLSNTITGLKEEDAKMKSMLGGMEGGMPDMNAMMQMMMGGGMNMDPSKMDFSQMMGMGMPAGQGQGMPGFQPGFGQQNSASPAPPNGQGFQPPTGPAAQGMDFNGGMAQPEQQGQMGGGRGRNRRGRGYY